MTFKTIQGSILNTEQTKSFDIFYIVRIVQIYRLRGRLFDTPDLNGFNIFRDAENNIAILSLMELRSDSDGAAFWINPNSSHNLLMCWPGSIMAHRAMRWS